MRTAKWHVWVCGGCTELARGGSLGTGQPLCPASHLSQAASSSQRSSHILPLPSPALFMASLDLFHAHALQQQPIHPLPHLYLGWVGECARLPEVGARSLARCSLASALATNSAGTVRFLPRGFPLTKGSWPFSSASDSNTWRAGSGSKNE